MKTQKTFSVSAKRALEIADFYGYKVELYQSGFKACFSLSDPHLQSPYPRFFCSNYASYDYVKRLWSKYHIL